MTDQYNENQTPFSQGDPSTLPPPIYTPIERPNSMVTAAFIMGILSIFTALYIYLPFILAPLAIVFAILSRGYKEKMHKKAKIGIALACIGLTISITIFTSALTYMLTSDSQVIRDTFKNPPTTTEEFNEWYDNFINEFY